MNTKSVIARGKVDGVEGKYACAVTAGRAGGEEEEGEV